MKHFFLSALVALFAISAQAQTTLRIENLTSCQITVQVNEAVLCAPTTNLGSLIIGPGGFVDVQTTSASAEFSVEVTAPWAVPNVYTEAGCASLIQTATSVPHCIQVGGGTATVDVTSEVVTPSAPGIDRQVNVYF